MRANRSLAVLMVVVVVAGALATSAGAAPATPTIDTETSDTSGQSEITDTSTIEDFNASTDINHTAAVQSQNGTSPMGRITDNSSGYLAAENSSWTNVSRTGGGTYWNWTFSEDQLGDIEHGINANVTLDLTVYNNSSTDSSNTTIQFNLNTTDERTVQNLNDADVDDADLVETETVDNELFDTTVAALESTDFSTLDTDDRAVNGTETDVVLVFSNSSVADDAANAVASDASDGDALFTMPLTVSSDDATRLIRVYNEDVPDSVDENDDTYGVYKEGGVGGEDGIVINLGDDFDDAEEVSVTGTLNAGTVTALLHQARTSGLNPFSMMGALGFGGLPGEVALLPAVGLPLYAGRRQWAG